MILLNEFVVSLVLLLLLSLVLLWVVMLIIVVVCLLNCVGSVLFIRWMFLMVWVFRVWLKLEIDLGSSMLLMWYCRLVWLLCMCMLL